MVHIDTIKHRNVREIGAEWISYHTWNKLQLTQLLLSQGWSQEQVQLAATQIISRAVYPASELKTTRGIRENSAVCELTGYDMEKLTKDKLYESSLSLNTIKDQLEKHLSNRTNELFDIEDKIVLYDLTNTYFEVEKRSSKLSKFGKSKEKRSDAKLGVLALVVNMEGFIKYSPTKPTGQGTRLGLSLSYDIIIAHGDELKVKTREGDGAKFIVHLPVLKTQLK